MNGPSPTRMRSAARASPAAMASTPRTAASQTRANPVISLSFTPKSDARDLIRKPVSTPDQVRGRLFRDHALAIVLMRPRRDLAIGPLLQFDDNCPHDRKHHEAREHLFGLHHLA